MNPLGCPATAAADAPPASMVQSDLACVHCSYNLRGLSRAGNCPECGKPVYESFTAPPAWALHQAVTMLWLAALPMTPERCSTFLTQALAQLFAAVATVAAAIGCWRLVSPAPSLGGLIPERPDGATGANAADAPPADVTEPSLDAERSSARAKLQLDFYRRALRGGAVLLAAVIVGFAILGIVGPDLWMSFARRTLSLWEMAAQGALLGMTLLVPRLLVRIGQWLDDPSLVVHARIVIWTLPVECALRIGVTHYVHWSSESSWLWTLIALLLPHVTVVSFAVYALLLGRLFQALRSARVPVTRG